MKATISSKNCEKMQLNNDTYCMISREILCERQEGVGCCHIKVRTYTPSTANKQGTYAVRDKCCHKYSSMNEQTCDQGESAVLCQIPS